MSEDVPTLTYHELTLSERDFLTAVANTPADATGRQCCDYVQTLRGTRPSEKTIYAVLPELVAYGFVHKADATGNADHYQLTEAGYQTLRDAADVLSP